MTESDFKLQAALKMILPGPQSIYDVATKVNSLTAFMVEDCQVHFDAEPIDESTINNFVDRNMIELKPYESVVTIPAWQLRCNSCIDFEACQGRKATKLLGAPCSDFKIAVIAKNI